MFETDTRVLLVDDSAVLRKLAAVIIGGIPGFVVEQASDAREALELLTVRRYDLLLTDYFMPGIDGLEFVRLLRKRPEFASLPIVLLVSEHDGLLDTEARSAGIDAMLIKPVDPAELRTVVRDLSGRVRSTTSGSGMLAAQVVIDAIPYPVMVLDGGHNVVTGNSAFWSQTGSRIGECSVVCTTAMHESGNAPTNCPLELSVRSGETSEQIVVEAGKRFLVAVHPLDAFDEAGGRLYLHITRPHPGL